MCILNSDREYHYIKNSELVITAFYEERSYTAHNLIT